jgi:hypothetical protein
VVALSDDAILELWSLYDATGIRPEYMAPVLWTESGFDPTRPNAAGAPYYGIAQSSLATITALGYTPATWLQASQADQIRLALLPYFAAEVKRFGPIRSATRAYQANFLPATLATVRGLGQIVTPGGLFYTSNASALDPLHHGAITLSDLALVMAKAVEAPAVQQAIARAYVLRPNETPRDPVYGQDFANPLLTAFLGGVLLAVLWRIAA